VFTRLGYIDCQHLARGSRPRCSCSPGSWTRSAAVHAVAAYNKITSKKDVVIYPDFGHENPPGLYRYRLNFLRTL